MTTTAKTPTVAIARVLRSFGLKQGTDFRVKGEYKGRGLDRERVGTYVVIYTSHGDHIVAQHADAIEDLVKQDGGFAFRVSVHYTSNGRRWTWIANYGQRTRDEAPAATLGRDDASQAPSEQGRKLATDTGNKLTGQPLPSTPKQIADQDPYAGLAQKRFGSLYWACQEAGQVWFFQDGYHSARFTLRVYNGRAQARGWYLTGPGLPSEGRYMAARLSHAAEDAADVILAFKHISNTMEQTARDWPTGTRVTNGTRTGAVNGAGWGVVTIEGHDNYGRAWVDVDWDAVDGDMGSNRRGRPFADTLTRV